ncbi:MAG TPA: LemA family protein [Planctomycetota bacterium]|nr:LemA family protein [Planctomycetota bacterium]
MAAPLIGVIALAVGLFVVVVIAVVVGMYNGLVRSRNETKNSWAQIDVQLKRRHDLIPNLVETVKGYAAHESKTLEGVIAARSQAVAAPTVDARIAAEGQLSQALGRLMVVTEQYPDLKANQNFMALQEELTSTENKISFARQAYNDAATTYNTRLETFPSNIIAGNFGFKPEPLFQVQDEKERQAPQVKF